MLQQLRELDRTESVRRRIKVVRNLIIDRLPRDRELVFDSYAFTYPNLSFVYKAEGRSYVSSVDLSALAEDDVAAIDQATFQRVATVIGMMLAPYHFLLTDFATVRVECGDSIDGSGRDFFARSLTHGLAEFRYRQGLDPTRPITVTTGARNGSIEPATVATTDQIILLNGGGKDTAAMAELARATGLPISWCSINGGQRQQVLERASRIPHSYSLHYRLDPAIRQNARSKWGHAPRVALYMALSLLVAVARRSRYVGTGNEFSASFGNLRYKGVEVNHQYSKSYEFETGFQRFLETSVVRGVSYFSLLRPFHDLGIAAMVSQMDAYLGSFYSCNSSNGTYWCGDCAKCAFTFLAMMPWTTADDRQRVFGANFIERPSIRKFVLDLTGGELKPWECVGTRDECQLALALALSKHPELDFPASPRRRELLAACAGVDIPSALEELVGRSQAPHSVPGTLWTRIQPEAARLTAQAIQSAREHGQATAG
jgi:hypothetical protein